MRLFMQYFRKLRKKSAAVDTKYYDRDVVLP
jgi:hypothetical protein